MGEQNKKKTIILLTCMIICVILTALLFTNSIECSSCEGKISGKYYLSISGSVLCKKCGEEYYIGWPGDLDNVSDKVDNTLRNILLTVEILGFGVAIAAMKNGGIKKVKKFVPTPQPVSGTAPVSNPKRVVEPKPVVTPAPTSDSIEKDTSGDSGRLKTTFKPITQPGIEKESPAFTGSIESASTPRSDNDRFKPAGDL